MFCSPSHERLYSLWLVFLKSGFDSGRRKKKCSENMFYLNNATVWQDVIAGRVATWLGFYCLSPHSLSKPSDFNLILQTKSQNTTCHSCHDHFYNQASDRQKSASPFHSSKGVTHPHHKAFSLSALTPSNTNQQKLHCELAKTHSHTFFSCLHCHARKASEAFLYHLSPFHMKFWHGKYKRKQQRYK